MRLHNISIIVVYVIIVALGLGVSWQVFRTADNIYGGTSDLVNNKLPTVQLLEELRGIVTEHERVIYEYYATTNQGIANSERISLEDQFTLTLARITEKLGVGQELQNVGAQFAMVCDMSDQLDGNLSATSVDWDLAREQLVMISEYGREINPLLDTLSASSLTKAETQREETLNSSQEMKASVAGYAVVIGVIAGLIALFINRYLTAAAERKKAQERLSFLAMNDEYSGLPNRYSLENALKAIAHNADEGALALIRVDRMERYSNNYGDSLVNELLLMVVNEIQSLLQNAPCQLYRLNDSTLALVMVAGDFEARLSNIQTSVSEPMQTAEGPFYITLSSGYTTFSDSEIDVSGLIKQANIALTHAIGEGGNTVKALTDDMMSTEQESIQLERDLEDAISKNELHLFYQPKVCAQTGEIIGFEALIRWHKDHQVWIRPDQFIPLAEQTGQILQIGHWVVLDACQQIKRWLDAGLTNFSVAVNISARQFQNPEFVASLEEILQKTNIPPKYLELEITESLIMQDVTLVIDTLHAVKKLGLGLAIDDFGTGYSSLSYLTAFPVDKLKIDKSFVDDLEEKQESRAIVQTIIDLAHHLQLDVVAEGVETEAQFEMLRDYGCEEIQGYLVSKPMPVDQASEFIRMPSWEQHPIQANQG